MATDTDTITRQSQATYKLFCQILASATLSVLVILGLMAFFLV